MQERQNHFAPIIVYQINIGDAKSDLQCGIQCILNCQEKRDIRDHKSWSCKTKQNREINQLQNR